MRRTSIEVSWARWSAPSGTSGSGRFVSCCWGWGSTGVSSEWRYRSSILCRCAVRIAVRGATRVGRADQRLSYLAPMVGDRALGATRSERRGTPLITVRDALACRHAKDACRPSAVFDCVRSVAQWSRGCEQERELDAECGSDAFHVVDGDVSFASFDGRDERAVEPRELGEFLLRDAELHARSPHVCGERDASRCLWSFHSLLHRLLRCLWCHTAVDFAACVPYAATHYKLRSYTPVFPYRICGPTESRQRLISDLSNPYSRDAKAAESYR
jgi:hypothetical protein